MRVVGRASAVAACLLSAGLAAPVQAADPAQLPAPAGLRITARTATTSPARRFASASGTVYRLQPATRYYVNVRVLSPQGVERSAPSASRQVVTLPAPKAAAPTAPATGPRPR